MRTFNLGVDIVLCRQLQIEFSSKLSSVKQINFYKCREYTLLIYTDNLKSNAKKLFNVGAITAYQTFISLEGRHGLF